MTFSACSPSLMALGYAEELRRKLIPKGLRHFTEPQERHDFDEVGDVLVDRSELKI